MSRTSMREVRVGVVVALAFGGLLAFVGLAGSGPGFLTARKTIEVIFRDGQGIRAGSPVRVAGIDAGRVTGVELAPVDGVLRAKVRLSMPAELVARLRQDARITVQASLTGQSLINIVDTGRSAVPLVPGQLVMGVESSFFDPVLEQVGLGPVERSHLSHTIAEVRDTVDAAGPRLRQILGGLQETVGQLRESAEVARPAVEVAAGRVEELARRLDAAKFEETLNRINLLIAHTEGIVGENREVIQATLGTIKALATDVRGLLAREGPKVDLLLDGFGTTRVRLDRVLDQAGIVATQGADLVTINRANLDRTVANVRDATDYGNRLVQKIYGNPFYLSPFYKPSKDDIRAQEVYDAANTFLLGAKELKDAMTTLQALRTQKTTGQMTAAEQNAYKQLYERAWALVGEMQKAEQQLAEGVRGATVHR